MPTISNVVRTLLSASSFWLTDIPTMENLTYLGEKEKTNFKSIYLWCQAVGKIGQTALMVILCIFVPKYLYQVHSAQNINAFPCLFLVLGSFFVTKTLWKMEVKTFFGVKTNRNVVQTWISWLSIGPSGILLIVASGVKCNTARTGILFF